MQVSMSKKSQPVTSQLDQHLYFKKRKKEKEKRRKHFNTEQETSKQTMVQMSLLHLNGVESERRH